MNERPNQIPEFLSALLQTGFQTGNIGLVVERYLDINRKTADLRRTVMGGLLYPFVLSVASVLLLGFLLIYVTPQFQKIFYDFGTQLPMFTQLLLDLSNLITDPPIWFLLVFFGILAVVIGLMNMLGGRPILRKVFNWVPLFGPLSRYSSLAQFCHLLRILIDNRIPLSEAIRLAGNGSRNADLAWACEKMSLDVQAGMRLEESALTLTQFPVRLLAVFRWEGKPQALSDSLTAVGDLFESQSQIQARLIGLIAEPTAILVLALLVGLHVIGLFMPLVMLLNDLS